MAEITMMHINCDFCPVQVAAGSLSAKKDFHKIGKFDVCSECFSHTFTAISEGLGAAWIRLHKKGDGLHNGRAVDLITAMCKIALYEQVGNAVMEFKAAEPA